MLNNNVLLKFEPYMIYIYDFSRLVVQNSTTKIGKEGRCTLK